jgi:hypothetical protein
VQCANPKCRRDELYLRDGSLRLVELEIHPDRRFQREDDGFPICSLQRRFFWASRRLREAIHPEAVDSFGRCSRAAYSYQRSQRSHVSADSGPNIHCLHIIYYGNCRYVPEGDLATQRNMTTDG